MEIACLGWGSLVWDPRSLPLGEAWHCDGPFLPIEFARESSGGRITLVIANVPDRVQALWALMTSPNVEVAKRSLASREAISSSIESNIGFWTQNDNSGHAEVTTIGKWAAEKGLDAII